MPSFTRLFEITAAVPTAFATTSGLRIGST